MTGPDQKKPRRPEQKQKGTFDILRYSQDLIRVVLEETTDAVFVKDHKGRYLFANRATTTITGRLPEALLGRDDTTVLPEAEAREIMAADRRVMNGLRPQTFEEQVTVAGKRRTYLSTKGPIFDKEDRVVGLFGIARDITERKEWEETVQASEKRYRQLFDAMISGFSLHEIICDAGGTPCDYRFLAVNAEFERITGLTRSAIVGKSVLEVLPGLEREWIDRFGRVALTGESIRFEDFVAELGRHYEVRAFSPEPGRFAVLANDITEHRRSELALRRYELLAGHSRDIILFMRSDDGRILEANAAAVAAYGYSREELLTLTIHDLRAVEIQHLAASQMTQADSRGILFETVHRRRDGGTFPVEVSSRGATIDGIRTLISVIRDITERRQSELVLREREELFRSTFENAAVGIAHIRPDGYFIRVNQRFCEILGYTREELLARSFQQITHPDDLSADLVQVERLARGEIQSYRIEKRYLRKDGSIAWTYLTGSAQRQADGFPRFFIAVVSDINQRKAMEEELTRAKEAAEGANRAKGQFLANMSHEIRTPLSGVMGMLEMVLDSELSTEQRRCLEIARSAADSLLEVINDILDFSRIEAKKLAFVDEPFSLAGCLESAVQILALKAREKDLDFTCRLDPQLPGIVIGDQARLRQILFNLIGNAVKFTGTGEVAVSAEPLSNESSSDRCFVKFSVRDTGIGIPADKLGTLFEAFSQVDGSYTRRFGGTGLGLAICRELVQRMGGEITVCSTPGVGSEFSFTARFGIPGPQPAVEPPVTEAPRMASKETGAGVPAARILLAEDDSMIRELLRLLIKNRQWQGVIVSDGRQAVEKALAEAFDLILMDVQMPEMDGLEATRLIRQHEEGSGRRTPIIALTAHAMREDRSRCLDVGMDDCLTKPILMEEFYDTIERHLARLRQEGSGSPPNRPRPGASPPPAPTGRPRPG